MNKIVLLTVGLPDTGKTTFCDWLKNILHIENAPEECGYEHGDVVTAHENIIEFEFDYLSSDLLLDSYAVANRITYGAANARYHDVAADMFFSGVKHCIANSTDVIFIDRHNLSKAERTRIVNDIKSVPYGDTYQIVCLDFSANEETRAKRRFLGEERGKHIIESVMMDMELSYEPPVDDDIVYADIIKINEENFEDMLIEVSSYLLTYLRS